jgi:hypothetical protein
LGKGNWGRDEEETSEKENKGPFTSDREVCHGGHFCFSGPGEDPYWTMEESIVRHRSTAQHPTWLYRNRKWRRMKEKTSLFAGAGVEVPRGI